MKNLKFTLLVAVLACGLCGAAYAGVTFLPASPSSVGGGSANNSQTPEVKCRNEGYTNTSCGQGMVLRGECPYSRSYYRNCCQPEYNYTREECENAGMRASRNSCGGYYKCI